MLTREQIDEIRNRVQASDATSESIAEVCVDRRELLEEVERLTTDPLPAAAWVREVERAAFQRGVAAMRAAAANEVDCNDSECRCRGDLHAERIRALPDPEDTE